MKKYTKHCTVYNKEGFGFSMVFPVEVSNILGFYPQDSFSESDFENAINIKLANVFGFGSGPTYDKIILLDITPFPYILKELGTLTPLDFRKCYIITEENLNHFALHPHYRWDYYSVENYEDIKIICYQYFLEENIFAWS